MKRTKEEKQAYFKNLRDGWQRAKSALNEGRISAIDAIMISHGMNISRTGFQFVSMQMEAQGLEGLPYLDAKTYQGWKESGFQVKKGEHSTLSGVTWIGVEGKKNAEAEEKDGFCFPKEYHLFHRSQVEPVAA